jgi:hypothetical protein
MMMIDAGLEDSHNTGVVVGCHLINEHNIVGPETRSSNQAEDSAMGYIKSP